MIVATAVWWLIQATLIASFWGLHVLLKRRKKPPALIRRTLPAQLPGAEGSPHK